MAGDGSEGGRALCFSQLVIADLSAVPWVVSGNEAQHLIKSLRGRVGDRVRATDGRGGVAELEITAVARSQATLRVLEERRLDPPRQRWWLATRAAGSRFDWLVEKAVELGAWSVLPLTGDAAATAGRAKRWQRVADAAHARWISEHIAFTRTDDVDLGHLNPVPPTMDSLKTLVDHAREVMDLCQRPLLLENITSYLRFPGEISETEFINRLCEQAGAGLLLDVTNLFINSRNHDFDPVEWLRRINPTIIKQLHIVGYSFHNGVWHDRHCEPIQEELLELATEVIAYASVEVVILERDVAIPEPRELELELIHLEKACESARCS